MVCPEPCAALSGLEGALLLQPTVASKAAVAQTEDFRSDRREHEENMTKISKHWQYVDRLLYGSGTDLKNGSPSICHEGCAMQELRILAG